MTSCFASPQETWEGDLAVRPLKVAVIREEFVALTRDPLIAVVLNQLLYWTQRVKDFDLLLREERAMNSECNVVPRHGWIYKSADELAEETMLHVSRSTMRRYLSFLADKGYITERTNPSARWDKTTHYRVNLRKLQEDLFALGYNLPGFPSRGFSFPRKKEPLEGLKTAETSMFHFETSSEQNETSNEQICSLIYLNRDYTETINRDHTQSAREISQHMVDCWKKHVEKPVLHLTPDRKRQLSSLLDFFFQNDLREWETFCERIKASPFLMGEGPRKWHVTLDWILLKENIIKVLEGNFDSPESLQHKQAEALQLSNEQEKQAILMSIQDPTWKEWCEKLSESHQISLFELKELGDASFMEFDGRLVWIKSADPKTINRIESVRLKLLTLVQGKFPNARNIRTHREEENREERHDAAFSSSFLEKPTVSLQPMRHKKTESAFFFMPPPFHVPLNTGVLYAE